MGAPSIVLNGYTTINTGLTIKGALLNENWRLTNDSDGYLRVKNVADTDYVNLAAKQLYASADLFVATTASIGSELRAPYIGINGTNTTYRLYVAGKTYIGNSCTITADLDVNRGIREMK